MEMFNVDSSNVEAVGYDEDSATLQVTFNNSISYQYFDVPEHLFHELRDAGSVGQYLHQHIKGTYRFSKV